MIKMLENKIFKCSQKNKLSFFMIKNLRNRLIDKRRKINNKMLKKYKINLNNLLYDIEYQYFIYLFISVMML